MRYYNKKKIDLHVMALRTGNLEDEFQKFKDYRCLNLKSRFSLKGVFEIVRYVRKHKISVLHTHLLEADFYGFLVKLFVPGIRLISTKHNTNDFRKRFYWGVFNKILSLPAYRIIAVSDTVKKFVIKHEFINRKKIITIYNGIDTERFKRQDTKKLRKELNIKPGDFIIGIVGRLHKQKGHIFLFRAVKKIKDKIKGLKVLVIGKGELEQELKTMVKELGIEKNVLFLGFRDDIPALYSLMDAFCLPSLYEGLPLVLAEAMSAETLVVCSDIPNNKEVVDDKKDGLVTKLGDANEMAAVFLDVYKHPEKYNEIRKNARKKVLAKFDYKTNLKKIEGVYLE